MSAFEQLPERYETIRADQEQTYRDLHRHPELSHQETRTAGKVAQRLTAWGCRVEQHLGGTGVVGVLSNGDGPTVLMRADMDALPVYEQTGAAYASTVEATDAAGHRVPVMHACGHDVHVACLLGAVRLLAAHSQTWRGTVVALFQPAEETGDGARGMVDDGLATRIPAPDVCMGQHVLPGRSGHVATRVGPVLSAADSMRVTVYGRGGHGSMPQNTIDPVVLAAMIVVRLQTVVAREVAPIEPAVLTVGSIRAGSKSNIIPDEAVLELNIRTYTEQTRRRVRDAMVRIVHAECAASGTTREPDIEVYDSFPLTVNDAAATQRVATAFASHFGERAGDLALQTASEDFSDIPRALDAPYTYWGIGGTDPAQWDAAEQAGTVAATVPANHSPLFLPVIQPTLRTGTEALLVAAGAWLAA
ncbi:amidohydrolase [Microbacterium sp. SYP-A9085]|uniref:amidohydrolase n=1 Tax=Microbacterium sp. SYP-A9085 TaxID=2664454 RepID=UPI00129B0470|nr:amidohydrolase [Microbacterium sp. SYP-A9085]MRH30033.1 amidohydrolase [Microbacterium sp. SYP-A9085]